MNIAFLKRAIEIAEEKSRSGLSGPFGAVVARGDEVLGEGWNQVVETTDPSAHAEIMAIRKACAVKGDFSLNDCIIYSTCEPCPMCLAAIYWARIPKIVYASTREDAQQAGFDDAIIYKEIEKSWENRSLKCVRAEIEAGKKLFEKWQENPNKVTY